MSCWRVVLVKELRDGLRDRRSLLSLLLFPLVAPLLVSLMLTQVVQRATGKTQITVPVAGREYAPGLVSHLEREGFLVIPAPENTLAVVRENEADLVLVVRPEYAQRLRTGRPASLELVIDASREDAAQSVRRVRAAIDGYGATIGALRLLAHGVNNELGQPIKIEETDVSTPEKRAAPFMNLVPMFVMLAAFMGGMYTATDATAGERERGSLEPLLLTPARRFELVLGKWLAAVAFAVATVLLTLGCTVAALSQVPLHRFGMAATLGAADAARVAAAVVPLTLFTCGLELFIASFARSFKEAQTYLSAMVFLPMLPALLFALEPMRMKAWMPFIPVVGQQALVTAIIRGEPTQLWSYVALAAACALTGVLAVLATARLFSRESIVIGR
ncbi:MAG: ABC transporter permease [Myxococcales bacterium]|nr:ABC transporter permease [Myxococcales bacterium]